uniref:Uncharacterized protein n=1 Tax=Timema shepardi TaxID=629360 RepID=A0A7R9B4F4_TIMSH|nr:unnamed protein product [Timema shepardi]
MNTLESDKLCSLILKKRKIKLGRDEHSTAIIKETRYFDTWSGAYMFKCRFGVEASSRDGVIAVIQKLSFRRDKHSGNCIDYFKRDDSYTSPEYCGQIRAFLIPGAEDSSEESSLENVNYAHNAFYDPDGNMDVTIVVGNMTLRPEENIDLQIAFTSYADCSRRRSNYQSCGVEICIWKDLFYDNVVNCPFSNCFDEGGCLKSTGWYIEVVWQDIFPMLGIDNPETTRTSTASLIATFDYPSLLCHGRLTVAASAPSTDMHANTVDPTTPELVLGQVGEPSDASTENVPVVERHNSTKMTIGAVATVVLSFLLFFTCLYIMRRNRQLCWSPSCAGPAERRNSAAVAELQLPMHTMVSDDEATLPPATAPPEPTVTIMAQEKDLPPPYESLFPAK